MAAVVMECGHVESNPSLRQPLFDGGGAGSEANHKGGNTSFFKTFFNGVNALSGVGILSIPFALASGGWLSLLFFFAIAIAAFYAGILIKRCMEADPTIRTYPDIGERAFGNMGRIIVSVFMYTELYLVVSGFLILEGDNLHNLIPSIQFEAYGLNLGGRESFVIIVALIILPSVWLDNLSLLSYISATGVVASVIIVVSIFWVGAFDGVGFKHKGELINWSGVPTSVSLYSFCYCAHPVFPTLYKSMKRRDHFSRVLVLCFICTTISYASMAVIGYLMFGPSVNSQITLNLPTQKLASRVAIYTTLVNPLAKYALMLEPVSSATENWFPGYHKKRHIRILIRTAIVATQVIVALVVPFFGYLMSLVGAFLSVTASIIVPGLCYLKIYGMNGDFEMVVILGTLVLSVFIAVLGTYTSLIQIMEGTVVGY